MKHPKIYADNNKLSIGFLIVFILMQIQGIAQQFKTIKLKLRDSIHIDCRLIEPGKFLMGSPDLDSLAGADEKPQRKVEITEAFYLGLTTVKVNQFQVFINETGYKTIAETDGIGGNGYNKEKNKFEGLFPQYTWKHPGWIQLPEEPVVNVSWIDANKFCKWLSQKTGKTVRLPSEEEWEYACRAGTTTIFFTGDSANNLESYANVEDDAFREKLDEKQNFLRNINRSFLFNDGYTFTAPVGSFKPNPWGLYDMSGNVWQLCNGVFAPKEPGRKYNNVVRGGAYNTGPEFLRCASRGSVKASSKYSYIGFRVAVTP